MKMWRKDKEFQHLLNLFLDRFLKRSEEASKDMAYIMNISLLRAEILKRDFTKRQHNIVTMIYDLSNVLGKEYAVIPMLQDFELCGVSKTKIKEELLKLEAMHVIDWNKEKNHFSLQKTDEWLVGCHQGANEVRAVELMSINFKDALSRE